MDTHGGGGGGEKNGGGDGRFGNTFLQQRNEGCAAAMVAATGVARYQFPVTEKYTYIEPQSHREASHRRKERKERRRGGGERVHKNGYRYQLMGYEQDSRR